ncbi:MAG: SMP-30/gluconolactonase/LRE family protein [Actinomycetota bacterium]|nr:SMP-30/gluconolactonase/LRE family protein [Actinomycetota bacterium]
MASGLKFPESSRWHQGALWFSDMLAGQVFRLDVESGHLEEVLAIDDQVSGLGWLPDGSLLVSCMLSRTVRRKAADGAVEVFADLSEWTAWPINDLVTDSTGQTYLGEFGYDFYAGAPPRPGAVYRISAAGAVSLAAEGLHFPNGSVILPGTSTLVIAETWGAQLTAFDISPDGQLANRRVWARLPPGCTPDGICVDVDRAIWVSSILTGEFLRVEAGGAVIDKIDAGGRYAIDCVLGGADGKTLFLLTSDDPTHGKPGEASGRIEAVSTSVPGPVT